MRFHLEDFWGKSPSRFVWAPRCCEKLMETGKNITSSTMESSLDGKLLTCGTWCRRRKEHLDLQNEERSKMGIFLKCHPCPDISFEPPEIFKFHLLFTSNIVFCVSFVSFLFPPSLKNSPKTISCPRPASPIIWVTCGAPMATPKEWPRHIQNSMNSVIILGYFDLHQSVVSRFYNIQYSGIIPNIQKNMQKMYIGSLWSSEIIYK